MSSDVARDAEAGLGILWRGCLGCLALLFVIAAAVMLVVGLFAWDPVVGSLVGGVVFLFVAGLMLAGFKEADRRRKADQAERSGVVSRGRRPSPGLH